MAIKKDELEKMNELLANGSTIAAIAKKYPNYDYWEIYWEVSDYSILGKKRTITNRINRLAKCKKTKDREKLAAEAKGLITELYKQLKKNSKKLIDVDRVLRK